MNDGSTSLRAVLFACLAWCGLAAGLAPVAKLAAQGPTRILITIGQNVGAPDDDQLQYAERDAERVAQLLIKLGDVDPSRSYVVTDASAERVRQVLTEVRGRAMELGDVVLIVYVSGHSDDSALRLGASRLPHQELRALLSRIPARVRLLVVDACTSGAMIRSKGGKPVAPFAIDLDSSSAVSGEVVITSTGPSEPAQEWDALSGALFTHHWLAALRGASDLDGDGRVTLFEAYSYTYDRTLAASSGAWAGVQHPSHEIELRGSGDLVLTRPGGLRTGVLLGPKLAGRYIITQALSGELVAEVDKLQGRRIRLALDPGRYLIRKPEGAFVSVGELSVMPNGVAALDESDFEQVPYADVARRGPTQLRVWSVELATAVGSGAVYGSGITPRLGVGLSRERGPWAFGVGAELGVDSFRGRALQINQREIWGLAQARLRMPFEGLMPFLGAHVAFGAIHQSFTRDHEQMIQDVFDVGPLASRDGLAGQLLLGAGIELPSRRMLLRFEAAGGLTATSSEDGLAAKPTVIVRINSGWRF